MTEVHAAIEIDAPPEQIWDVIMDPRRYGDWVTIHRKLGRFDDGPLREGFRVEQTLCLHHANFKVKWALDEVRAPLHAVWEGKGPAGSYARIVDELTPLDGGTRTRFDYRNEYSQPGGFVGRMASRVLVQGAAEREATRSLERLKAYVERS